MPQPVPVFDGHNDFVLRLLGEPERRDEIWLKGDGQGHLDLPRMQAGGFAGGFFAIYIPSPPSDEIGDRDELMDKPPFALPLPDPIAHPVAQPVALAALGQLLWMERAANGAFKWCRTAPELRDCMARGVIAGVIHMEGAEAIDPGLDALHVWHAAGLRSLGPVWSRPTAFGHGVPFRFPGSPDTGPGLTPAGKALVRECDRLGVIVDLSHLNEKGFDDVARISSRPLVATHSNAHAVTPSTRNLTDRQLAMIAESDGIVGLNFATVFLRPDGRKSPQMGWEPVMRHLDHLLAHLGEHRVGLGSDFDGATVPEGIADAAGLPRLLQAMRDHGFGEDLVRRIAHENWLAFLDRALPA